MTDPHTDDGVKMCPDCGFAKPLTEFYQIRAARYTGGVRYGAYCKTHQKMRTAKARREAAPDSGIKQATKRANERWAKANPEVNRQAQAKWRAEHPEEAAAAVRQWQLDNPEANREKARRYLRKKKGNTGS